MNNPLRLIDISGLSAREASGSKPPLATYLARVLRSFKTVLVPEMNMGQLSRILRAETLVDCIAVTKVQGQAFKVSEIFNTILTHSTRSDA